MKKISILVCLLVFLSPGILANAEQFRGTKFDLGEVIVTTTKEEREDKSRIESKTLKTHKVVDLAEILSDELVEATMIRKSGYGNEVALRGFGKSNLRFFVDDSIVEGACGSRKDPSFSHINLLTVDRIEIREGPFDVTNAGSLGGSVSVFTKKPREGFHSEILAKGGSFDYWSTGGYITGGNELIQGLIGCNYSEAGQYEDGDGNKLSTFNAAYNDAGKSMKAFKKDDVWGKLQFKPEENQTILFSHAYGNAEDIMTPRVGMDTESEKTNLSSAKYTFTDLGDFSEKLTLTTYHNKIEHNPSNKYRTAAANLKNDVETTTIGGKIENEQVTDFAAFTYGFDMYHRSWDGYQINRDTGIVTKPYFFPDAGALDLGVYLKADKDIDRWSVSCGVRGDYFETEANDLESGKLKFSRAMTATNKNTDEFFSGYFSSEYYITDNSSLFGGIGHSIRMPTLVERYLQASSGFYGNPDLEKTKNTEVDLGFRADMERLSFKAKGFYSDLDDFIYQEGPGPKTWTNIDAHIYGADVKTLLDIGYDFSIEAAAAYQQGGKDSHPRNNNDKNLVEIPPLKTKLALHYDNSNIFGIDNSNFFGILEWIHSRCADEVDIDAGEKKLSDWDVVNARAGYRYKDLTFNMGINNIFDKAYAVANSYEYDVVGGAGSIPKIVNEPGRFFYGSLSYMF